MSASDQKTLLVITGPTATGKTSLAAGLATVLDGEVISADSRQVYRGMNLGTGKDLGDFLVDGNMVPYHLIDIADPGYEYNLYEFQHDFLDAYRQIISRNKQPILCGGSGLYLEAAIGGYRLQKVPENPELRKQLEPMSMKDLVTMLVRLKTLHNITDITDRERLIRAIEIASFEIEQKDKSYNYPTVNPQIFGIWFERSALRQRITRRLEQRLADGMVGEVKSLLDRGIKPEQLMFYGLEYRYLTRYILGDISYEEMFRKLNTAIHQFAKRQVTWFRRMEKKGYSILWIDGESSLELKINTVIESLRSRAK